jgi:NAD(P)-dependent dehydrogenase (short-subunit alcohol dehydrogenase family)
MSDVFIVVGASGGVGQALVRRLAARGSALHLVGRDAARVQPLAQETGATFAVADVRDPAALRAAIEAAGPRVAGLAYCVGTINLRPIARLTDDDALRDFELNALGAARCVQAALPALKAVEAASVVLFSTVAVAQGFASHASVAMAKGAVEGLTRALAAELAPRVRVNAVAPSLTRTPLAQAFTASEAMAQGIAQLHALQRLGEPDDIAALADFLLSRDASWITGQVIAVDGGRSTVRTKG